MGFKVQGPQGVIYHDIMFLARVFHVIFDWDVSVVIARTDKQEDNINDNLLKELELRCRESLDTIVLLLDKSQGFRTLNLRGKGKYLFFRRNYATMLAK